MRNGYLLFNFHLKINKSRGACFENMLQSTY
nr:MAG TPA: hypothetical protein [Caudoviricetes sp.]